MRPHVLHPHSQQWLATGRVTSQRERDASVVLCRASALLSPPSHGVFGEQAFVSIVFPASGGSELVKQHFPTWNFPRIPHPHLENFYRKFALLLCFFIILVKKKEKKEKKACLGFKRNPDCL